MQYITVVQSFEYNNLPLQGYVKDFIVAKLLLFMLNNSFVIQMFDYINILFFLMFSAWSMSQEFKCAYLTSDEAWHPHTFIWLQYLFANSLDTLLVIVRHVSCSPLDKPFIINIKYIIVFLVNAYPGT